MSDYRGSTTLHETRDMTMTPKWLFGAIDAEFMFCLDAAALPETALCEKFLTPTIDALSVDWSDFISPRIRAPFVWLNPPYSDIKPWVDAAIRHQKDGIGTVMLVPQDTSAEWYPSDTASEVRHITGYYDGKGKWKNGRINFINKGTGEEMKGNPKGSMIIIFRPGWVGKPVVRDVKKSELIDAYVLSSGEHGDVKEVSLLDVDGAVSESGDKPSAIEVGDTQFQANKQAQDVINFGTMAASGNQQQTTSQVGK